MLTCCWLTRVTFMMVSDAISSFCDSRANYPKGTGLTDGYPSGGVNAHDVCVLPYMLNLKDSPHVVQQIFCPVAL